MEKSSKVENADTVDDDKKNAAQSDAQERLERLEIFGNAHGQYFYMFLMDLADRPTVEWLTAIGLREFVEEVQ